MMDNAHDSNDSARSPAELTKAGPGPALEKSSWSGIEHWSFMLGLGLVTLLFLAILRPFFGAVFWACVLGILFHPVQRRILKRCGGRANLSAILTLCVCAVLVVIPALFVTSSFLQQGASLYGRIRSGELDFASYADHIRNGLPALRELLDSLGIDIAVVKEKLSSAALGFSSILAKNAVTIGQNTLQFFVSVGLMLYMAFFLLRDGERILAHIVRVLPLGDERERLLMDRFALVTRATVKGNLVVAIVQGALGGLIFWILGIEAALLWGVVMTLLSLIPVVGAGLIWAPVAVYLFATGHWGQGLVLALFGAGVIGLVDNILRPILVGRDTSLPDYMVLLSTLGGFALFGMNGFVIGPVVAALFVVFWEIFAADYNSAKCAQAHVNADTTTEPAVELQPERSTRAGGCSEES